MAEKEKITFEQLIAGSLLKFDKIDSVDVVLLMGGLYMSSLPLEENEKLPLKSLEKYINVNEGKISLKKGLTLDSNIYKDNKLTLKKYLEKIQGDSVKRYFNNLDIEQFVLRKINLMYTVPIDSLSNLFNIVELEKVKELFSKRYITVSTTALKGNKFLETIILTEEGKQIINLSTDKPRIKKNK